MASDALQNVDMELVSKVDGIAREFEQRVAKSGVVIRMPEADRLMFFGLDDTSTQGLKAVCDTACTITMSDNTPFVLDWAVGSASADARVGLPQSPAVACLGLPIRNKRDQAVGAICALTTTPRVWSELDKTALSLAQSQIELLLVKMHLKSQINGLSKALSDYDDIVTMIAAHAQQTFSIHNPNGEMLFASNVLLQHVPPHRLEAEMRQTPQTLAASGGPLARGEGPDASSWRGQIRGDAGQVTFVDWARHET